MSQEKEKINKLDKCIDDIKQIAHELVKKDLAFSDVFDHISTAITIRKHGCNVNDVDNIVKRLSKGLTDDN